MNQKSTALAVADDQINFDVAGSIGSSDISTGASRSAFMPSSMGQAMEIAKLMAGSNFVPGHLRGKPGDCLAVVMQAARWTMDPFAVGNKTYFVNDRIAYEAQLVSAVVNASNVLDGRLKVEWFGEGDELECLVSGNIKGDSDTKTRRVKLKTIKTRNSPLWQQDPEQQLAYFGQRAWARLHTPEVLLGVYTPDEIESVPASGAKTQRLSSEMLANQAGVTVDQQENETHEQDEERAAQLDAPEEAEDTAATNATSSDQSEASDETAKAIDGPLEEVEQGEGEGPDPWEAKRAEIVGQIDGCKTIIDLNVLWGRVEKEVEAMPEDVADGVRAQFQTMEKALERKGQPS